MSVGSENRSQSSDTIASGVPLRRPRIHSDAAIAIGIVLFCTVVYGITTTFPHVPAALATGMGPEAFPRLLLGVLVVLAAALAFVARGKPEERREPIPSMVYWTVGAMLAFMGFLWLAGMAAALFVGFVGMGLLWGERRWLRLVVSGLTLSAFIYLLFVKGFGVPLPRGLVGDWLF